MIRKYSVLVPVFFALLLVVGVTACSDDNSTSGVDSGDDCTALALPSELAPATIAIEYFNQQNVPNDEEHSVFQQVKMVALSGNGLLAFGGNAALITNFLQLAPGLNIQPEANNGNCVWEIDFSEDFPQFGINAVVTVNASTTSNGVNWEVRLDGDLGDGEEVNDFLFLEGFTSSDETTGEWNFFDP